MRNYFLNPPFIILTIIVALGWYTFLRGGGQLGLTKKKPVANPMYANQLLKVVPPVQVTIGGDWVEVQGQFRQCLVFTITAGRLQGFTISSQDQTHTRYRLIPNGFADLSITHDGGSSPNCRADLALKENKQAAPSAVPVPKQKPRQQQRPAQQPSGQTVLIQGKWTTVRTPPNTCLLIATPDLKYIEIHRTKNKTYRTRNGRPMNIRYQLKRGSCRQYR